MAFIPTHAYVPSFMILDSAFGDSPILVSLQNSLSDHRPWNRINSKKFMQVEVDVKYMHTNFSGPSLSNFRDKISFQIWPNFPFRPWTIVHGHQKFN